MSELPDRIPANATHPLFFDAVLTPHRSLSAEGFWILMALICGVSFLAGIFFVLRGAWPVTGFFGLDVLLLYVAFKANYRSARLRETVKLTTDALVVERVSLSGRRSRWTFQPYWLRIEIDDPPEHDSQLTLTSHGRSLAIGSFLSPEERLEVALALRAALHRWRAAGREAGLPAERETSRAV
ncbi:MAG TPA: DUF2244 domain-containing protein [Alphaproteobacteria bacterium]